MRLHLILRSLNQSCSINLNYQYYLSAALYRWIENSSPSYARFLHQTGFSPEGLARRFKHFCFSQLLVAQRTIRNGHLIIHSPAVDWYVDMPVEATLQHLVVGIFEKQELYIEREENRFFVESVETLPEPDWTRRMKFRMLSPLTVSVPEDEASFQPESKVSFIPGVERRRRKPSSILPQRRIIPHYLRPNDTRLSEALRANILNKHASLFASEPDDKEFCCTLDEKFITQRGGPDRISKLITIKEGHPDETRVRGFMCPLTIEGNPQLIKLAYESGLGEKGSLGFGMIEIVR